MRRRAEVAEAGLVIAGFVAFGLAWATVLEADASRGAAYPPSAMERVVPEGGPVLESGEPLDPDAAEPEVWLVDGFNVLHAVVLGGRDRAAWWTGPRRAELLARAATFDDRSAQIWVVFDGARAAPQSPAQAGVREVFAPSADEWLLAQLRGAAAPERLRVVTADRKLADRARHRGARVISPRAFLERCRG